MCCDDPYGSWITSRKEYTTVEDFEEAVNKQIEIFNEIYAKVL